MEINVNIITKLMPHDEEGNREKIINYIIDYPDHNGRVRHNTEDEIRKILINLQEVVEEADKWHKLNPKKEEAK